MEQNYFHNPLQNQALTQYGWVVVTEKDMSGKPTPGKLKSAQLSPDPESNSKSFVVYDPAMAEVTTVTYNGTAAPQHDALIAQGWKAIDTNVTRGTYVKSRQTK